MLALSLIRGIIFYPMLVVIGAALGWLILPWRFGISPGSPHMMIAMWGGGVFWLMVVVIVGSVALSQTFK